MQAKGKLKIVNQEQAKNGNGRLYLELFGLLMVVWKLSMVDSGLSPLREICVFFEIKPCLLRPF